MIIFVKTSEGVKHTINLPDQFDYDEIKLNVIGSSEQRNFILHHFNTG